MLPTDVLDIVLPPLEAKWEWGFMPSSFAPVLACKARYLIRARPHTALIVHPIESKGFERHCIFSYILLIKRERFNGWSILRAVFIDRLCQPLDGLLYVFSMLLDRSETHSQSTHLRFLYTILYLGNTDHTILWGKVMAGQRLEWGHIQTLLVEERVLDAWPSIKGLLLHGTVLDHW